MIPVTYDGNGNTIKTDTNSEWYNYDNKKWAKEVIVTSASAGVKNNMTACESGRDYKQAGVNASTTGNIIGIYDLLGGTWERTMGVLIDINGNPRYASSGFTASTMPKEKYYDKYVTTTGNYDFSKGKLGDVNRETVKLFNTSNGGWYGDNTYMPDVSRPWFLHGGYANYVSYARTFNFYSKIGGAWTGHGSRAGVVAG